MRDLYPRRLRKLRKPYNWCIVASDASVSSPVIGSHSYPCACMSASWWVSSQIARYARKFRCPKFDRTFVRCPLCYDSLLSSVWLVGRTNWHSRSPVYVVVIPATTSAARFPSGTHWDERPSIAGDALANPPWHGFIHAVPSFLLGGELTHRRFHQTMRLGRCSRRHPNQCRRRH